MAIILIIFVAKAESELNFEPSPPIEFLGSYFHNGFTEENIYTYQLDIWHQGENVFGLYSFALGANGDGIPNRFPLRIVGSMKGNAVLLKSERINFNFTGDLSGESLVGRWTDSMWNGVEFELHRKSAAETDPDILKVSTGSYVEWQQEVETYLDGRWAADKQLMQDLDACANGVGRSCLSAGNNASIRGHQEKARQYYEAGCNFSEPNCCLIIGREVRAREILASRCTGQATMENNFACQSLGRLEEKKGDFSKAKEWYRKGCNDSIPKVCAELKRLEGQQ